MKRIFAKEEYCIGCHLCEVYCTAAHSRSGEIIKAYKEEFPDGAPRLVVDEVRPLSFAVQCRHCGEPECVAACMTGAMSKDARTGLVLHDASRCAGCWMCVMACPFGAIRRDVKRKVALKCDLCQGRERPACVENCPNAALTYEED